MIVIYYPFVPDFQNVQLTPGTFDCRPSPIEINRSTNHPRLSYTRRPQYSATFARALELFSDSVFRALLGTPCTHTHSLNGCFATVFTFTLNAVFFCFSLCLLRLFFSSYFYRLTSSLPVAEVIVHWLCDFRMFFFFFFCSKWSCSICAAGCLHATCFYRVTVERNKHSVKTSLSVKPKVVRIILKINNSFGFIVIIIPIISVTQCVW